MPFALPKFVTGISAPVSALRTEASCGVGEFADLETLAAFCKKTGITLVQLLPVNDTGAESSPYSALSAFALHPIYIRLQDVEGAGDFEDDIKALKKEFDSKKRFDYKNVRLKKQSILKDIFSSRAQALLNDETLKGWIKKNPWIIPYAVYMRFKADYNEASWKEWPEQYRRLSQNDIQKYWDSPELKNEHLFYAWTQMQLDAQFKKAAAALKKQGVFLKGDVPIMMNEDSCDAWAHPQYFRDDLRAGCPPDGFNPLGQNWGFPIYNWENLAADKYSWWTNRLKRASQYYQAYRIDHVLGFFRIWAIPERDASGFSGYTLPFAPITEDELAERGFTNERLRWISRAHIPTWVAQNALNGDYNEACRVLGTIADRIGSEELWLFKDSVRGEKDIYEANLPGAVKEPLAAAYRDRMVIRRGEDSRGRAIFSALWKYYETAAWKSLSDDERWRFDRLIQDKNRESEALWEKRAREILGALTSCADMIACAEDLGANPACVAPVLKDLNIHSLKVVRWTRAWDEQNQPYIPLDEYPYLSVTTPSVHDTSTLRGWWNEEGGREELLAAWADERTRDELRGAEYNPQAAAFALRTASATNSRFFIAQIQDLLDLAPDFYNWSADDERINKPGSVNEFNWTYRLPRTLEELSRCEALVKAVKDLTARRNAKETQ